MSSPEFRINKQYAMKAYRRRDDRAMKEYCLRLLQLTQEHTSTLLQNRDRCPLHPHAGQQAACRRILDETWRQGQHEPSQSTNLTDSPTAHLGPEPHQQKSPPKRHLGQQTSPLLNLPASIRRQILSYVLLNSSCIRLPYAASSPSPISPLLHVNRGLRSEGSSLFYGCNHFVLTISHRNFWPLQLLLDAFAQSNVAFIGKLDIALQPCETCNNLTAVAAMLIMANVDASIECAQRARTDTDAQFCKLESDALVELRAPEKLLRWVQGGEIGGGLVQEGEFVKDT